MQIAAHVCVGRSKHVQSRPQTQSIIDQHGQELGLKQKHTLTLTCIDRASLGRATAINRPPECCQRSVAKRLPSTPQYVFPAASTEKDAANKSPAAPACSFLGCPVVGRREAGPACFFGRLGLSKNMGLLLNGKLNQGSVNDTRPSMTPVHVVRCVLAGSHCRMFVSCHDVLLTCGMVTTHIAWQLGH